MSARVDAIPSLADFYIFTSLYTPFRFDPYSGDNVAELLFPTGSLDAHCVECRQGSVFKNVILLDSSRPISERVTNGDTFEGGKTKLKNDIAKDPARVCRTYSLSWYCARNTSHRMTFYVHFENGTYKKVGQLPSLADFQLPQIEKYRTVLADKESEFHRAIGLAAHGVGIGAFVYLRRIFEQLTEEARKKSIANSNLDEETFAKSKMPEKIKLLKDYLPAFLVKNKSLYGILSKGIHELTEKECQQYFLIVRNGIELILDERLAEEERMRKIHAAEIEIAQLTKKLK